MRYQGRSPINDVVRSVVVGAAMIPPVVLAGCTGSSTPTPPREANATPPTDDAGAPPNEVVRPRTPNPGNSMPTRGFSGAAGRRGARAT